MAYDIVKGWPSEGALDFTVALNTGQTIGEGVIAMLDGGKASAANYTTAAAVTDKVPGFIIGVDSQSGNRTMLMGAFIVEVDDAHYAADTYAAGDVLTAKAGKFAKPTVTGEHVVGKVLTYNATTKKMRILWVGNK